MSAFRRRRGGVEGLQHLFCPLFLFVGHEKPPFDCGNTAFHGRHEAIEKLWMTACFLEQSHGVTEPDGVVCAQNLDHWASLIVATS